MSLEEKIGWEIRRSYWQSHGGLEFLSDCNFCSFLFWCVVQACLLCHLGRVMAMEQH